jgi:hypoxanthine-guanine phosphoribosyltransferase
MKKFPITQLEFNSYVHSICQQIVASKWQPDYVVGISRGGLTAAVMISHYLNVPMKPLQVSLRDGQDCVSDLAMAEDAFGYGINERKKILVVDDINDTGATLNWIMKDWPGGCLPKDSTWIDVWNNNVRFAVIVDNLSSECFIKMDYVGIEINKAEDDVWVEFPYEIWWK